MCKCEYWKNSINQKNQKNQKKTNFCDIWQQLWQDCVVYFLCLCLSPHYPFLRLPRLSSIVDVVNFPNPGQLSGYRQRHGQKGKDWGGWKTNIGDVNLEQLFSEHFNLVWPNRTKTKREEKKKKKKKHNKGYSFSNPLRYPPPPISHIQPLSLHIDNWKLVIVCEVFRVDVNMVLINELTRRFIILFIISV